MLLINLSALLDIPLTERLIRIVYARRIIPTKKSNLFVFGGPSYRFKNHNIVTRPIEIQTTKNKDRGLLCK